MNYQPPQRESRDVNEFPAPKLPIIPRTHRRNNAADDLMSAINRHIEGGNPTAALLRFADLSRLLASGDSLPARWDVGSRNVLDGTYEFMRRGKQLPKASASPGYLPADESASQFLNPNRRALRRKLLVDEYQEYADAEDANDLVETVDGLLDLIVVAWSTLIEYVGVDLARQCAAEVVRTNLSKVDGSLGPTQFDDQGKILKPDGWAPPKIADRLVELTRALEEFEALEGYRAREARS